MPASATARLSPPPYLTDTETWKRLAALWMREAHQGHIANTGNVTLTSGTAQTVLTDTRIGAYSFVALSPATSSASVETPWISSRSKGAATITHANAASGDRTFLYCILG